jgi:acyl-CoA synthetase (AMP-forming)/AMP-acid ligase II
VSEQEIVEYCRKSIARYKVPRHVEFVSSLPKTSSGKVQRRLLVAAGRDEART